MAFMGWAPAERAKKSLARIAVNQIPVASEAIRFCRGRVGSCIFITLRLVRVTLVIPAGIISMADAIPRCMPAALTRKLHALLQQRYAHFVELRQSGRWSHYYDKGEFLARMDAALQLAEIARSMVTRAEAVGSSLPTSADGQVVELPQVLRLAAR